MTQMPTTYINSQARLCKHFKLFKKRSYTGFCRCWNTGALPFHTFHVYMWTKVFQMSDYHASMIMTWQTIWPCCRCCTLTDDLLVAERRPTSHHPVVCILAARSQTSAVVVLDNWMSGSFPEVAAWRIISQGLYSTSRRCYSSRMHVIWPNIRPMVCWSLPKWHKL